MSFSITDSVGLKSGTLAIPDATFSAGAGFGIWIKCADIYVRGLNLYSDADGSAPFARLQAVGSPARFVSTSYRSGTQGDAQSADEFASDTWALIWSDWDAATGDMRCGHGTGAGTVVEGPSDWLSWHGGDFKGIAVGIQRHQDGGSFEFGTGNALLAIPFIIKRQFTGGDLTALVAGDHPAAVFSAGDLYDYWPMDSKTSAKNSIVLSDEGGTVNISTGGANNPTVDDPPAGGDEEDALSGSALTAGHQAPAPGIAVFL